jgi:hypothetical protein
MARYRTLTSFLEASNEGSFIRRDDVASRVLRARVWLGMVSPDGGYLPIAHFVSRRRAEVAAWLQGYGARSLGRNGFAHDRRRGLVFELDRVSVNELF